jgi:adenosylcobinamide kinase/adenosylcobinamide-phosphate guanylyltransferase
MKVLYFGGQKSGKSKLAELKALALSYNEKPTYIATYDNSYHDKEMQMRIDQHHKQRQEEFKTIEEPFDLPSVINNTGTYLIDCISMWLLNTLNNPIEELFQQLKLLEEKEANIIFVLNDVNGGVIPLDKESRSFVDRSGVIGQKLASFCDEVYEVKLGLPLKVK